MEKRAALAAVKQLRGLTQALSNARYDDRAGIALRMHNLLAPLYVVQSKAVQHIEEALRKLKYPQQAVFRACIATITQHLDALERAARAHPAPHFGVRGNERVFIKAVSEAELRSAVEKGRLLHEDHEPFIHVFDAPEAVEDTLSDIPPTVLRPILTRMGLPADALLFFTTSYHPHFGIASQHVPSLRVCMLRSGVPVTIIKHRIL